MRNNALMVLAFTVFLSPSATAQESISANFIGIGSTHLLDTYISQEKFSGAGLTYLYLREYNKPDKNWHSIIEHEIDLSSDKDRSGSASEIEGGYNLYWGKYCRWKFFGDRLLLQAGGLVNANLGFIYNMTSSNNPAQARVSLNLMPSGIATYSFQLWRKRGDYDHNIVPTTFVSAPTLRHLLTLDWQARKTWSLRIGYLGNYQQAQVNNLKQHVYVHRIVIGFVHSFDLEQRP